MHGIEGRGLAGLPLAAVLLLCACSPSKGAKNGDEAALPGNDVAASNFANRMSGQPEPPSPAQPFEQKEKTDLLEFAYAYPAQAAQIPVLAERFGNALKVGKADALKMAREDRKAAREADYPFRAHSLETRWTVAADTPRFLALRSESYVYTGGAHGMTGYEALLWDKARKRETAVTALMTSPAAFAAAIRDRFCDALDKARAEKRGAPVKRSDDDDFTKCIDPMQQVLVPTSKDGKLVDGVTVVIGPYSAGPYAEGSYEIALPVDAAMRKAIKTEYQDAFAAAE
ncbi:DUF3298/DUF4163 domain-containing protein [Sphingobium indicum]|uniref:Deacetylase PdaC domain-containing protein n=2 Tax=Sphingobium indicum TaxID=332055 RepID=A0A1L5BNR0_SPHIB|nr:DUF4163 domain-containing protein [Sphingobium indicum]APL94438.1 hypothetical protein SIDU_07955 [Sphingobium indicum B90A]KEZ00023.1 hypothetical protein AI27_16870 [Sphingomonas sp. BHC-A]RYM04185.1 DUF3298/DUF4163 domain-containing protein [Sphingobium indicum]